MAIDEDYVDLDAVEVDDPEMPTDVPNPGALLDPLLIGKGSFYRVSESGTWSDPSDAVLYLISRYLPLRDTWRRYDRDILNHVNSFGGHSLLKRQRRFHNGWDTSLTENARSY